MLITGLETLIFRGRIHRNEIWKERERKKSWRHNGGDNGINYRGEGERRTLPRRRAYFDRFSFRPYGR